MLKKRSLLPNLIFSLFISFTFGIFAPLEMYMVNNEEMWFDIYDLFPICLVIFVPLFTFLLIVLILLDSLSQKVNKIVTLILFIPALCIYFQGNFLQIDYGKLGDETINWSNYTAEGVSNTLGWIGMVLLIAVLLYYLGLDRFINAFKVVAVCILLVQIVTLLIVSITMKGFVHKDDYVAASQNEWIYSKNQNMIILVLDTFDSRVFSNLMEDEENLKYFECLDDFTFYKDTLGDYTLTDFSIPQILTGEKYLNKEDYGPFIERAYFDSPFLNRLKDENYDLNIYTTVTLPQDGARKWISNWHKIDYGFKDRIAFSIKYYQLLAFRYLPHYLKKQVYFDVDDLDDYKQILSVDGIPYDEAKIDAYKWGNKTFYKGIKKLEATSEDNMFHFIHIKGIHSTRDLSLDELLSEEIKKLSDNDANNSEADNQKQSDVSSDDAKEEEELSLEESAKTCMVIIDKYLSKLKKSGIYDSSCIVIMADHGAASYEEGGIIQCPLLLVKGINEKHDFKISNAPISYDDLLTAFDRLLDGKTGEEIFDYKEGDYRIRTIYKTGYIGKLRSYSRNEEFIEYETDSPAYITAKLRKTGNVY